MGLNTHWERELEAWRISKGPTHTSCVDTRKFGIENDLNKYCGVDPGLMNWQLAYIHFRNGIRPLGIGSESGLNNHRKLDQVLVD